MRIYMNKHRLMYFLFLLLIPLAGCEKKYQRPDHYKIDLFADERQEGRAYVMDRNECFSNSDLVVASSDLRLTDSSAGRGKPVFIYKVASGEVLKTTRDSAVAYPFQFLSGHRLKLRKDSSVYIYLKKLEGYRFIAEEKKLKYQWLKGAPLYSVKKESN